MSQDKHDLFLNAIRQVRLSDFTYSLPESRIAQTPLKKRDQSKLLVYRKGRIGHKVFSSLPQELEADSLLVFNDTKVIRARLLLRRETGALIEILLLNPVEPTEVNAAMQVQQKCVWKCIIGRKKRWKEHEILESYLQVAGQNVNLKVSWVERSEDVICFTWEPAETPWAQIVSTWGGLPLPPYIHREATQEDTDRYQTVYAREEGAVAAPTAGLHFTDKVLSAVKQKGIVAEYITLHVSAGTFMPVRHERAMDHDMHSEQFILSSANIENLIKHFGKIIAVGTTSMRVLESLYWLGVDMLDHPEAYSPDKKILHVEKLAPYRLRNTPHPSPLEALKAVLAYSKQVQRPQITGETSILILPGYTFSLCNGLITNFHMPGTTLLLLIAAFVGDNWRSIYEAALEGEYRFLSYGDSSLLIP